MLVKAMKKCFAAGSRRRVGQVFDLPDNEKLPSYLMVVSEEEGAPAPSSSAPETTVIAGKIARVPKRPKDFDDGVI
jgi:hypothetical protein